MVESEDGLWICAAPIELCQLADDGEASVPGDDGSNITCLGRIMTQSPALTAFRSGRPTAYFWNTFFNDGLRDTGGAYIVGRKVHKRSTREMLLVIIDTMYVAAVEIWMGQLRVLSGAVHRYLGG